MDESSTLESASLTEQLVLLGLVELNHRGRTPAQPHELRKTCCTQLPSDGDGVVGSVSEADVMRSLYQLEANDLVAEETPDTTSPTGKGRPYYSLAIETESILEAVDDQSPLEDVVDELRES
ncbi:hypothetical protein ACFOZ7_17230 [Natribaculum luteum]|uniref:Transcriptional regulator n=1 Tax=Natribaculum luteum TaxID=1586232 RepID=A0ABD5P3F6_9EURY|nr:hypothetical protein [Natribaculum luteum]